jgi:CHAT domain-containing protein/tetratricopeptide (TPR) repeat protein
MSIALVLLYLARPVSFQVVTQTPTNGSSSQAVRSEPRALFSRQKISDVILPGEVRVYDLHLSTAQHARVIVNKGDLQLKISLMRSDDQSRQELISRRFGAVQLSLSTDTPETFHIQVESIETDPAQRTYDIQLTEIGRLTTNTGFEDQAMRLLAEADQLRERHQETAQRAALLKYKDAFSLYNSARDTNRASETLCLMGDVYFALSEYRLGLDKYREALGISETAGNESGTLAALHGIGYTDVYLGRNDMARQYAQRMLDILAPVEPSRRPVAYRRAEAQAINTLGEVEYSIGNLNKSIDMFERAFSISAEVGDRSGEALALLNLGYSHSDLGDARQASDYYEKALASFTSVADGRGRALAETALGGAHSSVGDEQIALDFHKNAGDYFHAIGNKQGEAATLNGVARAYQNLNDYEAAFEYYDRALRLYESIGNRDFTALNEFLVGRVLYQKGEIDQAQNYYEKSLALTRKVGDRVIEAHALKGIGTVSFSKGDTQQALAKFNAALDIYKDLGNRRSEAYVLNDIGHIQTIAGDLPQALANLQQALLLMREIGDRHGEALTLFNNAKAERTRDNLMPALSLIQDSISIGESLRTKVNNSQLRTSYFASVHEQYDLLIDILMTLHGRFPARGYAIAALLASEKARARSLLDSIMQEKVEQQDTSAASSLWAKEQEVLRALDEKAEYQARVLSGNHSQEDADRVSREIDTLTIEYQALRSQLMSQSSRQAALVQPNDLHAEDLQKLTKDDDSMILEFALGDERSYVWAITYNDISSYQLPSRKIVEDVVRQFYTALTVRQSLTTDGASGQLNTVQSDATCKVQSEALSKMLLAPVAASLQHRRILIVADGLLNFIPFEALLTPANDTSIASEQLLVREHEIVMLPSAITLAAIRMEKKSSARTTRTIFVLADPVFEKDDPRVLGQKRISKETESADTNLSAVLRDLNGSSQQLSRLPSTLIEAKAIIGLISSNEGVLTTGFAANKEIFLRKEANKYQILHLATHGLLDTEHPDLSGLVLSLVDENGKSLDGFVRLHDIYNLDLRADLVVLSACRTGLGKDVQGEGVVGLSSGFMYAGSKSVVASLWKVDDTATAEFMSYFYKAMLKDGLPPAAALRVAKLEMLKQSRWGQPFYWAGFVIQGEFREAPIGRSSGYRYLLLAAIIVSVFAAASYSFFLYRRRTRKR